MSVLFLDFAEAPLSPTVDLLGQLALRFDGEGLLTPTVTRGDSRPLGGMVYHGNAAVDLAGATLWVVLAQMATTRVLRLSAEVDPAKQGHWTMDWEGANGFPGLYQVEVEAHLRDGQIVTFPSDRPRLLRIRADLG